MMKMRSPERICGIGAARHLVCALLISVHAAGFSREPNRRALQVSYTYDETTDASYCKLYDASVCWGNTQRFLKVIANGPFAGIDVGDYSAPAVADFDGDGMLTPRPSIDKLRLHKLVARAGDLDLVVGEDDGELIYVENTGTSTAPVFVQRTGSANPFDGIDVGSESAPAVADFDGDGTLRPRPSIAKLRHALDPIDPMHVPP